MAKGQTISKANNGVLNSPKTNKQTKRTQDGILSAKGKLNAKRPSRAADSPKKPNEQLSFLP